VSERTANVRSPAPAPDSTQVTEHCSDTEYVAYLKLLKVTAHHRQTRIRWRMQFMAHWPNLSDWLTEPLMKRLGRRPGEHYKHASDRVSYYAQSYLWYLGLTDRLRLDYPFLLGVGGMCVEEVAVTLKIDWQTQVLLRIGEGMGYKGNRMAVALGWTVPRIALHTGIRNSSLWTDEHLDELQEAIRLFRRHPISSKRTMRPSLLIWPSHLRVLGVLLHHRGNKVALPRRLKPLKTSLVAGGPLLRKPAERWLAIKAATWAPVTTKHQRVSLEQFLKHLEETAPEVGNFSQLTEVHASSYVDALMHEVRPGTGRPLSIYSRRTRLSAVAAFLRDAAALGWANMPTRPFLDLGALPRLPQHVPRFIPTDELDKLMAAVRALPCAFQRAALLTARWSGARRDEIARLSIDCLDAYPDGTARLRIPAGKTYRERLVPLHTEAADGLRTLITYRKKARDRPIIDPRTHTPVRYLFLRRGCPISKHYLFDFGLGQACLAAGLIDSRGKHTVTAHRFRHTVGTQLAERGAKLHTIMSVLGHESPHMSMVYARISDAEVLRDYRSVLGPGALIAGRGAEAVRAGQLGEQAVDWLRSNFLKTELELGHCLRLPSEGPCECDLYLTCAKFVTTPAYAPRLRERHQLELTLAEDARKRKWPQEIQRHCGIAKRIECLLADLGQPVRSAVHEQRGD
jgi:integrase